MDALKDCPFCGGSGLIEQVKTGLAIVCVSCGAVGPTRNTAGEAEAHWNIRPPFAGLPRIPEMIRREKNR